MQADYPSLWQRVVQSYQVLCDACAGIKVSIEFKPTDESTRFSAVPSTGAAMLLVQQVGHCRGRVAGENKQGLKSLCLAI